MRQFYSLYTNTDEPVQIQFTEIKMANGKERHDYKVVEPAIYAGRKQGVTATFDIIAKPELIQWAANEAVKAMENGVAPGEAKYAHRNIKEAAGGIGTAVHYWIEQHLAGKKIPYSKEMAASVEGYLAWEKQFKPKVLFSERVIFSKAHDYAGKVDLGCELDGRYGIIDFKTGSCEKEYNPRTKGYTGNIRARTDHFVQDAGYDIAIAQEDNRSAEFYGVLYIPVDGKVEYFETDDVDLYQETFIKTLETRRNWNEAKFNNKFRVPTRR